MPTKDDDWNFGISIVKVVLPLMIALVVFGLYARGVGWLSERTFAPLEEQVRHDTFKRSQAYNDGLAQDLGAMYLEDIKATREGHVAIRSVVLHRVANYPIDNLPPHLRTWVMSLRNER